MQVVLWFNFCTFLIIMQKLFYFFFFFSFSLFSQEQIKTTIIDSTEFKASKIFGIGTFNAIYYTTEDYTFHKKTKDTILTYTNFQLGEISSANIFNPLKINIFYKDFNTVILLDNRLAEFFKINFTTITPYRNISFVSTGFDNTLWIFNQDTQQLELYDYLAEKSRFKTIPVSTEILDLKSDYNYCYLLTKKYLYIYNYFGSLIHKYKNEGYESLAFDKVHLILKASKKLYILVKDTNTIIPIDLPNLLINQFLVTNETLYIYDDEILRQYQLKLE